MANSFRCVTNNPLLKERGFSNLEYHETDVLELFKIIQREVEKRYSLLSHPLSGSIRPDITPYKTVLLSTDPAKEKDKESEALMVNAIRYAENLYGLREVPVYKKWSGTAQKDFQLVDLSIVECALEVAQMNR